MRGQIVCGVVGGGGGVNDDELLYVLTDGRVSVEDDGRVEQSFWFRNRGYSYVLDRSLFSLNSYFLPPHPNMAFLWRNGSSEKTGKKEPY